MTRACRNCNDQTSLLLCRNCASLTCRNCLEKHQEKIFICPVCVTETISSTCGACGEDAELTGSRTINRCPICKETELGDPNALLIALPKEYFDNLSSIKLILEDIRKLHELLARMVSQIQYARLLGMYGFPSIERKLKFMATLLTELNDEMLKQLQMIKTESYAELRGINYFKDTSVDLYRVAHFKIKAIIERTDVFKSIMGEMIDTVKKRFASFIPDLELLNFHQKNYMEIRPLFPRHERYAVAVIPNVSVSGLKPRKFIRNATMIFAELKLMFLNHSDLNPIETKVEIDYSDIKEVKRLYTVFKGSRIRVSTISSNFDIRGTEEELKNILTYFEMIQQDPSEYMVPSEKDISTLHSCLPNIFNVENEVETFLDIIHSRLFSVEQTKNIPRRLTQIEAQKMLSEIYQQLVVLGNMVRDGRISPSQYRDEFERLKRKEQEILGNSKMEGVSVSHQNPLGKGIHLNIYYNEKEKDEGQGERSENLEEQIHPYSPDYFTVKNNYNSFMGEEVDDFHL